MQGRPSLLLTALLVLAACAGRPSTETAEPAPHAQPAPATPEAEERLVHLFESLAASLGEAGDCDAFARRLDLWLGARAEEVRQLVGKLEGRRDRLEREAAADLDARYVAAMDWILAGADRCVTHDEARAAFTALDALLLGSQETGVERSEPGYRRRFRR